MSSILITGSAGLVGSSLCEHFSSLGWDVYGLDSFQRAFFFGQESDTRWNQGRLAKKLKSFRFYELDIRDREKIKNLVKDLRPKAIVHTASQPSHDKAAEIPFIDFEINAVGTLNLLEAVRHQSPSTIFVHFSTNKVYGDRPNSIPLVELATRWDYALPEFKDGIAEDFPVDASTHSLFGVSKLASDLLVQEYGRYFGMYTCCLRGGCLTGPNHSAAELHGFLSYLVKCNATGIKYHVYGYKGKQVRDNIHAKDVARFVEAFIGAPRKGEIYNLGGGRLNSCSILEAFKMAERLSGRLMNWDYVERNRVGDHNCYISDLKKMRVHYPAWDIRISLDQIMREIYDEWQERIK